MVFMNKFPVNDPWQQSVPEHKREYYGVCAFRIEMEDGTYYEDYQGICHAGAYPQAYHHNLKWKPKAVYTDLRRSKDYKDWFDFLLDENVSPYRKEVLVGHEKIVGDDGFLRAVKLTNMQTRSKSILNFLVMTRMPFECQDLVKLWRSFVKAGIHPCAALMACHVFRKNANVDYRLNQMQNNHQAIDFCTMGTWQPSVKRLMEGYPDDNSDSYYEGRLSARGFSAIWGNVSGQGRIQVAASATNKVAVAVYTGSFPGMYRASKGEKTFGLILSDNCRRIKEAYKFDDIVSSAPKWSAL